MVIRNTARQWLAVSALLVALILGISGALATAATTNKAQAAANPFALSMGGLDTLRETILPAPGGPAPRTGPASAFEPLLASVVPPVFGANFRANTDTQSPNLAQQEPSIAVNPLNPLNVVAMAKDERGGSNTKQNWLYTSTDGGVTWLNQIFPHIKPLPAFSSDPIVNWSDDGICYITSLPYGSGSVGIQVAASTDGGITFQPATQVTSNPDSDKEWTWIDNFPSSPYYHRMYIAWRNFGAGADIILNYSSDRGQTWSADTSVVNVANQFPMPVVLPNGDVIVTYRASSGSAAFSRSTNGGVTFGSAQIIDPITTPQCPPDNAGCSIWRLSPIPSNSVNPVNGSMVLMWADGRTGTALVRYSRSTNNGATWSASALLSSSGVPNTYQVEPWVESDEEGTFHSIWYDNRENPNTSVFNIYYSQSTDDGATWSNAVRISTATSDLRIGIPTSYNRAAGDYIQVTASQGNVYAAWTDTRSGTGEDIYVVRGTYGGNTPTPTPTNTPIPTNTNTPVPTFTNTPIPTNTPTNTRTDTPTTLPTDTPTPSFTPSNPVTLVGHVLLQGRPAPPDPRWSVPLTFTLHLSPTGPTNEYTNITTDQSGYFTVTAPMPGTYDWRVKNPHTLANSGVVTLSELQIEDYRLKIAKPQSSIFNLQSVIPIEMGLLREGDANNDNCVNVSDMSILRMTYGKGVGDPGYDPRSDFNGDNAVTLPDFNLLRSNFGLCGAGPVRAGR